MTAGRTTARAVPFQLACVAVLGTLLLPALDVLYADRSWLPRLSAAVGGGLLTGVLVRRAAGTRLAVPVLAVVPLVAVTGLWAVAQPDPGLGTSWLSAVGRDVGGGLPATLALNRPVAVTNATTAVPFLALYLATYGATVVAWRSRAPLGPVALPFLLLLAELLLTAGGDPAWWIRLALASGFAAAAAALAGSRRPAPVPRAARAGRAPGVGERWRLAGHVLLVGALVAVLGTVVDAAPRAMRRDPFDPQQVWFPPVPPAAHVTPLSTLKGDLTHRRDDALFTVRFDGPAPSGAVLLTTATLDTYDGQIWSAAPGLRYASERLVPGTAAARARGPTAKVTISGLTGSLLPVPERPVALSPVAGWGAKRVLFDATTSTVAASEAVRPGLAYSVAGLRGDVGTGGGTPVRPAEEDALTSLPDEVKAAMAPLSLKITGDVPENRVLRLLTAHLRALPYSVDAPPGHALVDLSRVLREVRRGGPGYAGTAGDAEQHAAAFAVLARAQGVPARVVVGYRLPRPDADGGYTVRGSDAHAWAQAEVDGRWLTVDPTDPAQVVTWPRKRLPETRRTVAAVPPPPPPAPDPPSARPAERPVDTPTTAPRPWPTRTLVTLLLLVTGALALGAALGLVATPVRRRIRRFRRRRHPDPAVRVLGAWQEVVAGLRAERVDVPVSATPRRIGELAGAVGDRSRAPVLGLVPVVDAVIFGARPIGAGEATDAWRAEAEWRRQLRRRRSLRSRLRVALDPRPLSRAHRRDGYLPHRRRT